MRWVGISGRTRSRCARPALLLLIALLAVGVVAMHAVAVTPRTETPEAALTLVGHVDHGSPATIADEDDRAAEEDGAHSTPHALLTTCLSLLAACCLALLRRPSAVVAADPAAGTDEGGDEPRLRARARTLPPPDLLELSVVRC